MTGYIPALLALPVNVKLIHNNIHISIHRSTTTTSCIPSFAFFVLNFHHLFFLQQIKQIDKKESVHIFASCGFKFC